MPLEVIVIIHDLSAADAWAVPSVKFAIPIGAAKKNYSKYTVVAAHDERRMVNTDNQWLAMTQKFPLKYGITPVLEDAHDAQSYVEELERLSKGLFSPIYQILDERALSSIPVGSHVSILGTVVTEFTALKQYKVWVPRKKTARQQWLEFCEFVTRGTIPTGVLLQQDSWGVRNVLRRGLHEEKSQRSEEWKTATSIQNLISHWEAIANQYERISRAGRESQIGRLANVYGGIGIQAGADIEA